MTKALSNYHGSEKTQKINDRINSRSFGLGFWAAVDAMKNQETTAKMIAEQKAQMGVI